MMLETYWPKAAAVNACIKNEAETAEVSVLLAVHQPSLLVCRNAGTNIITPATDDELVDAFLTDNVPGGALLLPVTGPSGAGKSHVIRWLDARLQRSPRREKLHIIRIPKSASLRTVVELILQPLANDARHAKSREDLTRAVTEVNVGQAVVTFRAHLENALASKRERMIVELHQHKDRTHLKALIGHAEMLPRLFSDAALDHHFIEHVLSRVVARALRGRSDHPEADDTLSQFIADDLILPTTLHLNQAAQRVQDYYQLNIATQGVERLQPVVDLLNDVVDTAISNVFQLEQSTSGITLQEIILAVREVLFNDGKDLVLLVEDFAALAGIQDVLLKVCIYEGEYEGKKVRATMRTAMALTDGYLAFRDTILTRAQREWVVGGREQSDDEIRAGVVAMVGAYLNAARWGEDELVRLFKLQRSDQPLTNWLPAWYDHGMTEAESDAVAAFGFDSKGAALFPFNRHAIEQLADRHLAQGTRLIFNPRRVINEILRSTLLMRQSFEASGFPPADFQSLRPNANLANWIRQTHQPEPIRRRLGALLAIWGGNPADPAALAHVPPATFTAFNLPTPAELASIRFVPEPPGPTGPTNITPLPPALPTPREDPKITALRAHLDAWADGTQLGQTEARDIRNALFEMLKDAVDWPRLRIRPSELRPSWITIPHARGNPQSGRKIIVCDDPRDEDGLIRAGLMAAVSFVNVHSKHWTYPGADDDYVSSTAIVDHLVAQLTPMLVSDAKAQACALARALITQSRIAGLAPPIRPSSPDAVLISLFAEPELRDSTPFDEAWDKLRSNALGLIGAKPARTLLQIELLARIACFQGESGRTPFAIDIARLLETVGGDASVAEISEGLPEDVRAFIRPIADSRLWSQLTPVTAKLAAFNKQIGGFIDDDFDKAGFIADLQEIVRLLAATGTTPSALPMGLKEFERRVTEFRASPIVEIVSKTTTIIEADREQIAKLLNALGSLDLGLIGRTMCFLGDTAALVTAAEHSVAREEVDRSQADPAAIAREIIAMLSVIAAQPSVAKEAAE